MSYHSAIHYCKNKGKQFIKIFEEYYNTKNDELLQKLNDIYNDVSSIRLSTTEKPLARTKLKDWFFTACALPQDFMDNPTPDILKAYDDFYKNLLENKH